MASIAALEYIDNYITSGEPIPQKHPYAYLFQASLVEGRLNINRRLIENYLKHHNSLNIDSMISIFTDDASFESVSDMAGIMKTSNKSPLKKLALASKEFFDHIVNLIQTIQVRLYKLLGVYRPPEIIPF